FCIVTTPLQSQDSSALYTVGTWCMPTVQWTSYAGVCSMYFSHLMLCDRREGLASQERYEQQLAEVRLLDQLGYWCCWFAEHHFSGYALMPDCLLMAAAAARETRRIRLGAGVVVLLFQHHPIRVAEQAAM